MNHKSHFPPVIKTFRLRNVKKCIKIVEKTVSLEQKLCHLEDHK